MTGTATTAPDSRPAVAPGAAPATTDQLLLALAQAVAAILQPRRTAWTKAEAAGKLGCTESWLEEKARKREIPFARLSGAIHFTDAHLAEIITLHEIRPAEKAGTLPAPVKRARSRRAAAAAEPMPARVDGVVQLQAREPRRRKVA